MHNLMLYNVQMIEVRPGGQNEWQVTLALPACGRPTNHHVQELLPLCAGMQRQVSSLMCMRKALQVLVLKHLKWKEK